MKSQIQHLGLLLMAYGLLLMPYGIQAQDYQYQWAKSGGGTQSGSGSVFNEQEDETIRDVVVDADNNYYFLADLQAGTNNFSGISLTHYGSKDIAILALDCEGNLLWHHTIGGSSFFDNAYKLGLDSTNGLYIGVNVLNQASATNGNVPVHFSEDDVMPLVPAGSGMAHEAYKYGFLLKFDKDTGELLWRKDYQGLVTQSTRGVTMSRLFIDSNDVIHQYLGFKAGTHLDGLITVEGENTQFFLVKFDTNGNILGTPAQLPMTSQTGFHHNNTFFVYDEQLNQYYIAGMAESIDLSYGGVALQQQQERFYILAFDADTFDELWRKEIEREEGWFTERLRQVIIDENSNIYLTGTYSYGTSVPLPYFGDFVFSYIGNHTNFGRPPFTLKLNSAGEVQWIRVPDDYTTPMGWEITTSDNRGITLNGNEIGVIPDGAGHIWGDFSVNRPEEHGADPVLLRLDKETGEVIGLHDVLGSSGVSHHFYAITTDNDSNYVVGGYFSGYQGLFTDSPNGVGPLSASGKTDFFMAKLSAYACGSGGPGTNPCEDVVVPAPTGASEQTLTAGMTLADLDVEGENLQWYADEELTEPLAETHVVADGVTYYVTQTIGVCTGEALAVTVATLGVSDFQKLEVKLHPNPTSGMVYIEASQELQSYEVYNLIGQRLLSDSFTGSIDMKDLSKGTYIIRLTTQSGEVFTEKVVRQ